MSEQTLTIRPSAISAAAVEKVLIQGDLSEMTPGERVAYYRAACESLGLNYLTKPFEYLALDGKLVLYARRDATDQLRSRHKVDVRIVAREKLDDVYVVTARATTPDGRSDESIGAVPLAKEDGEWKQAQSGKRYFAGNGKWIPLHGDALANAIMKAETKAKRRVTLSIVGLGWLDESEIGSIADAQPVIVEHSTGEIINAAPVPMIAESRLKTEQASDAKASRRYEDLSPAEQVIYCRQRIGVLSASANELQIPRDYNLPVLSLDNATVDQLNEIRKALGALIGLVKRRAPEDERQDVATTLKSLIQTANGDDAVVVPAEQDELFPE